MKTRGARGSRKRQFTLLQLLIVLTALGVMLGVTAPWLRQIDGESLPLLLSAAAWVIVTGLIAGLGVLPLRRRDTASAVKGEAVAHCVALLGVMILLVVCVPPFEHVFREFEFGLAAPAQRILQVANTIRRQWFLAVPGTIAIAALDIGVFGCLHLGTATRWLARGWSVAATVILLSIVLFLGWAVAREFTAIQVNLSRREYLF